MNKNIENMLDFFVSEFKNVEIRKNFEKLKHRTNAKQINKMWIDLRINENQKLYELLIKEYGNNFQIRTVTCNKKIVKEHVPIATYIKKSDFFKNYEESRFYQKVFKQTNIFFFFEKKGNESFLVDYLILNTSEKKILKDFITVWTDTERKFLDKEIIVKKDEKQKFLINFTKPGDQLSFHVRPKAVNSNDVYKSFEGPKIPKQTLWINKEILQQQLENKKND
ncbi:PDDEXK family nuclease [Mesoplasma florum]|uniref:hypothetical protein n=1 Tax=Mesoplasma florum TaxID=2151 RepID=UPI000D041CD8|nr:hypothetical protein [Mesoplasma florum]AVN58938.1 hypothetical protein CG009_01705 [Mesoplasma florum]